MKIIRLTTKRDGSETVLVNCDHIVTVEALPRPGAGSSVTISGRAVVKCVETPDVVFGFITGRDPQQQPQSQQTQAPQPVYQAQPQPQAPQPVYQAQPQPQAPQQPQIIRRQAQ